jgi:hypothetical protein
MSTSPEAREPQLRRNARRMLHQLLLTRAIRQARRRAKRGKPHRRPPHPERKLKSESLLFGPYRSKTRLASDVERRKSNAVRLNLLASSAAGASGNVSTNYQVQKSDRRVDASIARTENANVHKSGRLVPNAFVSTTIASTPIIFEVGMSDEKTFEPTCSLSDRDHSHRIEDRVPRTPHHAPFLREKHVKKLFLPDAAHRSRPRSWNQVCSILRDIGNDSLHWSHQCDHVKLS